MRKRGKSKLDRKKGKSKLDHIRSSDKSHSFLFFLLSDWFIAHLLSVVITFFVFLVFRVDLRFIINDL